MNRWQCTWQKGEWERGWGGGGVGGGDAKKMFGFNRIWDWIDTYRNTKSVWDNTLSSNLINCMYGGVVLSLSPSLSL